METAISYRLVFSVAFSVEMHAWEQAAINSLHFQLPKHLSFKTESSSMDRIYSILKI